MQPLEKSLRSQLERAVTEARTIAEQAARAALAGLSDRELADIGLTRYEAENIGR